MKTPQHLASSLVLFAALSASIAKADAIPYPKAGTVAPEVPVYASSSGGITVYYYGSTAAYTDYVEVMDVQTGYNSGKILGNKTTTVGASTTVGAGTGQINAGDQLVFFITSTQGGTFASLASYNSDGINHAYITSYSGGTANGVNIPAGLFVGLEDVTKASSDLNYNDDTFVFTGVNAPAMTPEPGTLLLLATGMGCVGMLMKRRRSKLDAVLQAELA